MRAVILAVLVASASSISTPLQAQEESFELPTFTDAERWTRAATLLTAVLVADIVDMKNAGRSAEDAGRAAARTFGPPNGWMGADTPWRLFRGMYRNWMSYPEYTCDILEASDTTVRARCSRPYLAFFGDDRTAYGVSVEEYEASGVAFAAAIADYHGMDWHQEVSGEHVLITIRKR